MFRKRSILNIFYFSNYIALHSGVSGHNCKLLNLGSKELPTFAMKFNKAYGAHY
jgi:hypothetical protein